LINLALQLQPRPILAHFLAPLIDLEGSKADIPRA